MWEFGALALWGITETRIATAALVESTTQHRDRLLHLESRKFPPWMIPRPLLHAGQPLDPLVPGSLTLEPQRTVLLAWQSAQGWSLPSSGLVSPQFPQVGGTYSAPHLNHHQTCGAVSAGCKQLEPPEILSLIWCLATPVSLTTLMTAE